jgi:hypothetical protein
VFARQPVVDWLARSWRSEPNGFSHLGLQAWLEVRMAICLNLHRHATPLTLVTALIPSVGFVDFD